MKVLMIGGSGFIGRHVAQQLSEKGHDVTNFHRGKTQSNLVAPVREIIGDRNEIVAFREQFQELEPDVVIDIIAVCEDDARNLIKALKGIVRRAVIISSADVYRNHELLRRVVVDSPDPTPSTETSPLRANLFPYRAQARDENDVFYNYEKIVVERVVTSEPDFPVTVLRLPVVYGPGDQRRRIFPYLKRMDDVRPAILVEKGFMDWRWTRGYVENVAAAISWAAGDKSLTNRIYNVGESRGLAEKDWIRSIAEVAGWNGKIVAVDPSQLPERMRSGFAWEHNLETDTSLIRRQSGFSEPVSFGEGISRTVDWDRANPPSEIKAGDFDYLTEDQVLAALRV